MTERKAELGDKVKNEEDEDKTLEELRNLGIDLPKWPACIIRGPNVPTRLAEVICVQTTGFELHFNNQRLQAEFERAFGLPQSNDWDVLSKAMEELDQTYGVLADLDYLRKHAWGSDSSLSDIQWMHWDGTIRFDANIGKWPSVTAVYQEWAVIAKRYPALELECQLFPCEIGEIKGCDSRKSNMMMAADSGVDSEDDSHHESDEDTTSPDAEPVIQFSIRDGKVAYRTENFDDLDQRNEGITLDTVAALLLGQNTGSGPAVQPRMVPAILKRVKEWANVAPAPTAPAAPAAPMPALASPQPTASAEAASVTDEAASATAGAVSATGPSAGNSVVSAVSDTTDKRQSSSSSI